MAIKIKDEPDVTLSRSEYNRYIKDYQQDYMFYSGTPPTLNEYIYRRQQQDKLKGEKNS